MVSTSFYSSTNWQKGKKGPPPIFASIGIRHPQCIECDIELRAQKSAQDVLEMVSRFIDRFDAGNLVIALAELPKLLEGRGPEFVTEQRAFGLLAERVIRAVPRLEPRGLSMVTYAAARLHWQDRSLIAAVVAAAPGKMPAFGPTDVAKLAWSFSKMGIKEEAREIWALLSKEAAKKCYGGSFIDISMIAWAFASSGQAERVLFGQLATAALEHKEELPAHTIANLAWAFAKGKIHNPQLFTLLARRAIETVELFDPQSISNVLWAHATLDIAHEELFAVFADFTVKSEIWRRFSPQMASNLLWAFAKVGITDVPIFTTFAKFIELRSDELDTQNISNSAWAYALAELPSKDVFEILRRCCLGRLHTFKMEELCGLLWAFVKAGVAHSPIFEEAVELLRPKAASLDQQSVSNLLWILASAGHIRGRPIPGAREMTDLFLTLMLDMRIRLDSEGAAMTIWALWRMDRFHDAWTLYVRTLSDGRHPAQGKTGFVKQHAVDGRQRYFQVLLMEAERRGDTAKQVYLWKQMAADFFTRSLRSAALNCALMALIKAGDREGAIDMIRQLHRTRLNTGVTEVLARRLGLPEEIEPAEIVDITIRRRPQQPSRFEDFHYKEAGVLDTVLSVARPGDARSVHSAIEDVGLREVWLKVAGGEKAVVIDNVLRARRPRLVLEYGTYVGYTCTRMALQVQEWGGRVVSMEMDPVNAMIARNFIELSDLSHAVKVQLGHSDDCVPIVFEDFGPRSVDLVFMDQRGTKFHEDLKTLENMGLLGEPAVIMADNVLKPGAPYHVWRIGSMPHYQTDIIDLREFGSAQVEDWMTVSWVHRGATYGKDPEEQRELVTLAREADRFRLRAMATSMRELVGEQLDEFAARFTAAFVDLGIHVTMVVQTEMDGTGGAASRLVALQPGEAPPKWDGEEHREVLKGGRWHSVIGGPPFRGEQMLPTR